MDRKDQIFVSSTSEDLRDERNEVIHIPVGIEDRDFAIALNFSRPHLAGKWDL